MASTDIQDCCSEGGKICRLPVDFCCGLWSAKVEVGRHACSRSLAIQWNKLLPKVLTMLVDASCCLDVVVRHVIIVSLTLMLGYSLC